MAAMGAEDDLIADYRRRLPGRMAELEAQAARGAWRDLCRAVHKLRGSAAVYGFAEVSRVAAEIEETLIAVDEDPGAEARGQLAGLLVELRGAIAAGTGGGS